MVNLKDIVAISCVRTPIGRFGGSLKDVPLCELGAIAMKGALERANVSPNEVDEVIYGCSRQAGNGPNAARTAALMAKISVETPAFTLNMACPSGMKSIMLASQGIMTEQGEIYIAGGMESMSTIPYLLKGARFEGFKLGNRTLEDGWSDSIDPIYRTSMGQTAENIAQKYKISREHQDQFALQSHRKAVEAIDKGLFEEEIVPVTIPEKKKQKGFVFSKDEALRRDTSMEKLALLPAVFAEGGTVTAGNACPMSDGAAALVLTTRERAASIGAPPLFSIVSFAQAACDGFTMGEGPNFVVPMALKKANLSLEDMDLYEVNEAFAAQILANERVLKLRADKLNVNGGAIALGHPTGISGARIVVTLVNALRQRDNEIGIASICGNGGVTTALVIKREA